MWRRTIALCVIAIIALLVPAAAQETENVAPPPILWVVPSLQFYNEDGATRLFRGLDAAMALPISPRVNITGTYHWDFEDDNYVTALFNYDHPLRDNVILRGSVGMVRDDFSYGLTVHRAMERYGVGLFARSVDGDFEGGLMMTHKMPWGLRLRKTSVVQRTTSDEWPSGAGSVGDLGARGALTLRMGGNSDELFTTPEYFPHRRHNWPRPGLSAQAGSFGGVAFNPPAEVAWRFRAEGPVRTPAAIVDGVVYAGSHDGWLYALDVNTGRQLWRFPANSPITGPPAWADDHLFFGTEQGDVFCVAPPSRRTPPAGIMVWRFRTGTAVTASPLVTETGVVVVGSCDGYIYALDRRSGEQLWKMATGGPVTASASKIARRIPAGISAEGRPTARSAGVLVGSSDGRLYAIEEVSGQTVWTVATDGPITAASAIVEDTVYLGNRAGTVYCLNAANGLEVWTAKVRGQIAHSPAVSGSRVFVTTTEGRIAAFDRLSGAPIWESDMGLGISSSPVLVRGGVMYITSRNGNGHLWALSQETGQILWAHEEREPLATSPAIAGGHLVVGGDRNGVYAFRQAAGSIPGAPASAQDEAVIQAPQEVPVAATPVAVGQAPAEQTPAAATPSGAVVGDETITTTLPAQLPPSAGAAAQTPAAGTAVPIDFPKPTTTPEATQPQAETAAAAPAPALPEAVAVQPEPTPDTLAAPKTAPAPAPTSPPVLATLQITLADGQVPVLLCNDTHIYVGGLVRAESQIAKLTLNGREADISGGQYLERVDFSGPGEHELVVEATGHDGNVQSHVRRVVVLTEGRQSAARPMTMRIRDASPILSLVPGLRGERAEQMQNTLEIRDAGGALVREWVLPPGRVEVVSWNGTLENGEMVPPGDYTIIHTVFDGEEPLSRMTQPLRLDS